MTLAYDVTGDGPTVLLLHSTAGDRRMWEPQVPVLTAAGYQALRCDLRGFGGTPPPDAPYNDADDVARLLDVLAVDRTAVIAASGGGQVAQELAARDPTLHGFSAAGVAQAGVDVEPIAVQYDVATITAPVLLMSGDHDLPDFRAIAVHLAGRLPQARHVPLPWAGHLPSMERPDETNRLLLDFLTATLPPR